MCECVGHGTKHAHAGRHKNIWRINAAARTSLLKKYYRSGPEIRVWGTNMGKISLSVVFFHSKVSPIQTVAVRSSQWLSPHYLQHVTRQLGSAKTHKHTFTFLIFIFGVVFFFFYIIMNYTVFLCDHTFFCLCDVCCRRQCRRQSELVIARPSALSEQQNYDQ